MSFGFFKIATRGPVFRCYAMLMTCLGPCVAEPPDAAVSAAVPVTVFRVTAVTFACFRTHAFKKERLVSPVQTVIRSSIYRLWIGCCVSRCHVNAVQQGPLSYKRMLVVCRPSVPLWFLFAGFRYRCGTRPGRRGFAPSPRAITAAPTAPSSPMTSPGTPPLTRSATGSARWSCTEQVT